MGNSIPPAQQTGGGGGQYVKVQMTTHLKILPSKRIRKKCQQFFKYCQILTNTAHKSSQHININDYTGKKMGPQLQIAFKQNKEKNYYNR